MVIPNGSEQRSLDTLTEDEEALDPGLVATYLHSQGWQVVREREGVAQLWEPPASLSSRPFNLFLPLDDTFDDYNRRFKEAIQDLVRLYQVTSMDLLDNINSLRSDVFFVRLDQVSADQTIPFGQAKEMIESLQRMMRAAATTVANPHHSHKGRRPKAVAEFLDNDLRFGHTRRGSFVLTVAARLDEDVTGALPPEAASAAPAPTSQSGGEDASQELGKPYPRRVMETLSRGLTAAAELARGEDATPDMETALSKGASLELVQSLLDVSDHEGLRQVNLSFKWSELEPVSADALEVITVVHEDLPKLRQVRDRMQREIPPQDEVLVGRVASLERSELTRGEEQRSIILEADVNDRLRKVRVPLSERDYEWAIRAHQARLLFTVSGTLVKRRSWELEGNIVVDTSLLEVLLARSEQGATGQGSA